MRLHYPHCELAVAADVDGGDIAPEAKAAAEFLNTYLSDGPARYMDRTSFAWIQMIWR